MPDCSARPSIVVHKTAAFGSTDTDPGQRFFYEVRNKIWTLRARAPLAPGRARAVRRLDAAPLGPHVRQVDATAGRSGSA